PSGLNNDDLNPQVTWGAQDPSLRGATFGNDTLTLEDDAVTYSLVVVGRGDFNRDGKADLALFGDVEGKQSSYYRTQYVVITRCQGTGLIRVVSSVNRPFVLNQLPCN